MDKEKQGKMMCKRRCKKDLEWQRSNKHSHEHFGAIFEGALRGQKGQKVHTNFATNIAMESHCHTICDPEIRFQKVCFKWTWRVPQGLVRSAISASNSSELQR